ncbi:membrane protein [Candidatus Magnetoovum chiemensis]|nr:membrane protein [Candidatus Magnetoovum chiemensis]
MGLSIFISYVSFDSARVVVSFVMVLGSLAVVYYLISTFKGLFVNRNFTSKVFIIMVIVIVLTAQGFIIFSMIYPIFCIPAYLLFSIIVSFSVVRRLIPSCIQ